MIYSGKSKRRDILMYVALSVLLVFCVCFSATGAWFTDTGSFSGNLEQPDIVIDLNSSSESQNEVFYISSSNTSDLSKSINIKITNSNVDKLVVRYWITQEWGTMSGSTFTPSEDGIGTGLSVNCTGWTRGYIYIVDELDGSLDDYLGSGIYYYYNDIVTNDSTIQAVSGFTIKSGYENLTARITIYVEVAPASDLTLDTMWKESDENGNLWDGSATDAWIESIKGKR